MFCYLDLPQFGWVGSIHLILDSGMPRQFICSLGSSVFLSWVLFGYAIDLVLDVFCFSVCVRFVHLFLCSCCDQWLVIDDLFYVQQVAGSSGRTPPIVVPRVFLFADAVIS